MSAVGHSVTRKDGWGKVSGQARYVDDLRFPGMLHARTIRAPIAAGDLHGVDYAFDTAGFTIVEARDIPGQNVVALIEPDQPCLAATRINHAEEPVALLAHPDREALWRAPVQVRCTPGVAVLDARQSPDIFKRIEIRHGHPDEGFAASARVVEGEYTTSHQEQLYIEPNGMVAVPEKDGVVVYGSLQCPHYVHAALCVLLGLSPDRVRVVQTETGGGFGGKEEYPSIIAGHAALLALKSGRPVKLVYDRLEDMAATTKRHPSVVRHRTGVSRDGRLLAMEIDVLLDGGAYTTLTPVVLSRGVLHATGPYRCDHVVVRGRAVRTNTPPNGAFRGFGAPQTLFAAEVHMERIAETLGLDPVELRHRSAFPPGDVTATGQRLGDDCCAVEVLEAAVGRSRFHERRAALAGSRRGIGLSLFFHGTGFTGSGEDKLKSEASLELTERGARILVGSTEIGQGTRTILAQIVADSLGVPYDDVDVHEVDTAAVPNSGPTVASRTCTIVGGLLERCARTMRERLGGLTGREYLERHGPLVVTEHYERPGDSTWDDATYRGDAYATYGYGCDVVEVELDPDTWEVRPISVTTVQDVGKAIHPGLVQGQIEGGTVQGLGFALTEQVVMRDGRMQNGQLTNYIIPTTADTPPIDVQIYERPYARGPFGAKGVGEMPIDGPAPAVANALRHLGLDVRDVPATPERLMETACVSR
jgi:CO/xanthine dehydrogenase Mo-binding subunit